MAVEEKKVLDKENKEKKRRSDSGFISMGFIFFQFSFMEYVLIVACSCHERLVSSLGLGL
jgi:hypothetical protein